MRACCFSNPKILLRLDPGGLGLRREGSVLRPTTRRDGCTWAQPVVVWINTNSETPKQKRNLAALKVNFLGRLHGWNRNGLYESPCCGHVVVVVVVILAVIPPRIPAVNWTQMFRPCGPTCVYQGLKHHSCFISLFTLLLQWQRVRGDDWVRASRDSDCAHGVGQTPVPARAALPRE